MADYGPKMSRLSEPHQRFVVALVDQLAAGGGMNYGQAAAAAGYPLWRQGGSNESKRVKQSQRQRGHEIMQREDVLDALHEVAGKNLRALAAVAVHRLGKMVEDPKSKGHATAVLATLDRTGYGAEQRISVEHTDLTGDALLARIEVLARKHGLDPAKLLGGAVPAVKVIEHEK